MQTFINTLVLAGELDSVQQMSASTRRTEWFGAMDERILHLLTAYPQLTSAYEAFANARQGIWPRRIDTKSWEVMQRTTSELAAAVRKLGNVNIALCERTTRSGTICRHALLKTGTCVKDWHAND